MEELTPIIGIEIHLQLKTHSKVFCGCSTAIWKEDPNTHTCPVCLALPGALPVINRKAVEDTILMALALNCRVAKCTYFERKNYFYPDLPKGFQISQKRAPIGRDGYLELGDECVKIWEIHLEEDTAKSTHTQQATLLDFNKSGIPLVEIVSAPCIHSVGTLDSYAKEIRRIARALEVSGGDMEKGQMRFEANVSVGIAAPDAQEVPLPDYRVEIKNLNSFKSLRDAVDYEIERQSELIRSGKTPVQETRGWDVEKRVTFPQREKEYAHDYRYFPEPDLPPITISEEWKEEIRKRMPVLPEEVRSGLEKRGVPKDMAEVVAGDERRLRFFEELVKYGLLENEAAKLVVNRPEVLDSDPRKVVKDLREERSAVIADDSQLSKVAEKVIAQNPQPVRDYQGGKEEALQFLVGQMMKVTQGKADPQLATAVLKKLLNQTESGY